MKATSTHVNKAVMSDENKWFFQKKPIQKKKIERTQVVWCDEAWSSTAGGGFSLALYSRMREMEALITSAPHSESGATGSPGVRLAWSTYAVSTLVERMAEAGPTRAAARPLVMSTCTQGVRCVLVSV